MPRHLQYRLHNLVVHEKCKESDVLWHMIMN
jgi:hypothetical protein